MKSTSKRMWMRAGFAVFALSASTLMVSCGKKEEPKEVAKEAPKVKESNAERFTRLTGIDRCKCPVCKTGIMQIVRELPRIRSPSNNANLLTIRSL